MSFVLIVRLVSLKVILVLNASSLRLEIILDQRSDYIYVVLESFRIKTQTLNYNCSFCVVHSMQKSAYRMDEELRTFCMYNRLSTKFHVHLKTNLKYIMLMVSTPCDLIEIRCVMFVFVFLRSTNILQHPVSGQVRDLTINQ